MNNRINIEDKKLKEIPYTAPEGYFESLPDRIESRINGSGTESGGAWNRFIKPAFAMAASFGLIMMLGYGIIALSGGREGYGDTDYSSAEYALMQRLVYDIDIDDDSTFFPAEDLELSEDEIIEYLMSEDRTALYLTALNEL